MPLSVIPGTYRIVGASPDGDSIRFYADDPHAWTNAGIAAKPNAQGGVQLRLDAIDALETHYTPPHAPHSLSQPAEFGDGAASALLTMLGFTDVTRSAGNIVTASSPAELPGYVLSRAADVYGRAIALAFGGTRPEGVPTTGTAFVDIAELQRSANHRLLAGGLVYPTFYSDLYVEFRTELTAVTLSARNAGTGLWAKDSTLTGFTVDSVADLTDRLVILPKLFRRLTEYLADMTAATNVDLSGLGKFLQTHVDDALFTVPAGRATTLDSLLTQTGTNDATITLTLPPEQIVFLEQS